MNDYSDVPDPIPDAESRETWQPIFKIPLWSDPNAEDPVSPIMVRCGRAAAREYVAQLRDARSLGMGSELFDVEASAIEKYIDYLDEEFPV